MFVRPCACVRAPSCQRAEAPPTEAWHRGAKARRNESNALRSPALSGHTRGCLNARLPHPRSTSLDARTLRLWPRRRRRAVRPRPALRRPLWALRPTCSPPRSSSRSSTRQRCVLHAPKVRAGFRAHCAAARAGAAPQRLTLSASLSPEPKDTLNPVKARTPKPQDRSGTEPFIADRPANIRVPIMPIRVPIMPIRVPIMPIRVPITPIRVPITPIRAWNEPFIPDRPANPIHSQAQPEALWHWASRSR